MPSPGIHTISRLFSTYRKISELKISTALSQACRAGVCKVVRACRSLTVLQLMRCSGPFGDELGAAFLSRRPLLLLKELRIVGGAQLLTDQGLAKCISRCVDFTAG